jgi:archaemetzincin
LWPRLPGTIKWFWLGGNARCYRLIRVKALIQPMGSVGLEEVIDAASKVEEAFPIDVSVRVVTWRIPPPLDAFNFRRMQYNAEAVAIRLYDYYKDVLKPGEVVVVGVVDNDGYVEGLNFVFGLALPRLGVAVVFTKRLEGPRPLLVERLAKEIVHEIGHLLGLDHCGNEKCVMRFSNTLAEVDYKELRFCESCSLKLAKRYREGAL